jgi:hypothetical protein
MTAPWKGLQKDGNKAWETNVRKGGRGEGGKGGRGEGEEARATELTNDHGRCVKTNLAPSHGRFLDAFAHI